LRRVSANGLRQECQELDVARAHDSEMPAVERRDCFEAESLGHRDDGGVGSAEGQIGVGLCQLDDAREIASVTGSIRNRSLHNIRKKSVSAAGPRISPTR
jgi:hypothetical protein